MSPTFEVVLAQVNALSETDGIKLAMILDKSNGSEDNAVVAELRPFDEKKRSSDSAYAAIVAERIQELQDRFGKILPSTEELRG